MKPEFAASTDDSYPIWLADSTLPEGLDADARNWATATGFSGKAGQVCLLPGTSGAITGALIGIGSGSDYLERFALAKAASALPEGAWHIQHWPDGIDRAEAAFGWLLAQYAFDRYRKAEGAKARLVAPDPADAPRLIAMAESEFLTRDLINTPANDMGPDALEAAARDVAQRNGFSVNVISDDALLEHDFPMIHAVGRAGAQAPRLIELMRGDEGPSVTLVGKGVCFDTGGLDIKPAASMKLMKKDMGGAATVLGLAQMLVATEAADGLRLRVLIPAVENAIAGNAFRPGDILRSRKGLTVEVNNTDAEGRLVLADAMAYAAEDRPDWLISMATLTGAARVALGPDLPPFYCDDDDAAAAIQKSGLDLWDPVWRMPFWEPYEKMIEPGIADLDNAPAGGMAGSITAALFLRHFAEGAGRYAHFDIYGWQPSAAPGRAQGGVQQGARALLGALPGLLA
ncbi:leucyl aminopeptidase family protein [Paracoccus aerodenitrificans]|uniref:leucyl aminopeptidase family protein n=1 Tax=Paracoccus aerodenitrificans TaxID=3017781 RepID=UPI0022EFE405|nr:leucyl aminopeptidase family protein [Paracoccus aerodenitrificans]WBU63302.1 leucyl aminopeptidase family protein [Paracoccus aerodenitrificans]